MVIKKLLILLVFLIGLTFVLFRLQGGTTKTIETPIVQSQTQTTTENREVGSADGSMKLKMFITKSSSGSATYSFSTTNQTGKTLPFFEKTTKFEETMSLPANSWSPNNKYFFIEDKNGYLTDYLVFKASGESFMAEEKYLNATVLFNQKVKDYNLKSITGWDDPVLMSVRTVNGPHFWFDITTQSFIQLAR